MELRQTIRTGIRNIRRAWWEPGLMLAISALLVAAAWLWIPAPLVENPVQTELLYIQVDSGTHGMVRWKPKTMVERQTAGPLWTTWPPSIRKTPSARPIRPWRAGPICTSTFGRRTATRWWRSRWAAASAGGSAIPGMAAAWPWRRRCSSPRTWRHTFWRDPWGAVRREPVNGADQLGKAGECWYLLTDVGKIGMLRA